MDLFPSLTSFLESFLLWLMYLGILLVSISFIIAAILFLPIFGLTERKTSLGAVALKMTIIGLFIILLAIPARNALLVHFPLPPGVPAIPLSTPTTPQASPTTAGG